MPHALLDSSGDAPPHAVLDSTGDAPVPRRLRASAAVLAIVMPLHAPKLPWAQRFLQSVKDCDVGKGLGWFPVFSSVKDMALAANASVLTEASMEISLALVVHPARINPVTSKKWLGLRYVFASSSIPFAMALDAEVVFSQRASVDQLHALLLASHGGGGAALSPRTTRLVFGTAEFAKAQWWPSRARTDARPVATASVHSCHNGVCTVCAVCRWPPLNGGGRPILRATHESCGLVRSSDAEVARRAASHVADYFWWFGDAPLYERLAFGRFWERLEWRPRAGGSLSWYALTMALSTPPVVIGRGDTWHLPSSPKPW